MNLERPYLVIPKLIEQPTWGGDYIAKSKQWDMHPLLAGRKIGQSYELFSGSNLSLLNSSEDPQFKGELTDRDAAQIPSAVSNSVPLAKLMAASPAVLGQTSSGKIRKKLDLLIKFTQAQGNSFQIHIKAETTHPNWIPKPESWYYFEPGLITLGVKPDVDWQAYEDAVTIIDTEITAFGKRIKSGEITHTGASEEIQKLLKKHDPWQFVNLVKVERDQLIDLSGGGLHHSWEEDSQNLPLGNVLYELQSEAMDDISTLRNFDKGKLTTDGSVRVLNIKDYFALIDRSEAANNPKTHTRIPKRLETSSGYMRDQLMSTRYYSLEKLVFSAPESAYSQKISQFRHIFVKSGKVEVSTAGGRVNVSTGHSAFVPALTKKYKIKNLGQNSEVLISY